MMLSQKTFLIRNRILKRNCIIKSKKNDYVDYADRCQVFQVNPPFAQFNINDIEDCFAACTGNQTYQQREELFYSRGIDYYKVFKYYDYVKRLNKIYKNSPSKIENEEAPCAYSNYKIRENNSPTLSKDITMNYIGIIENNADRIEPNILKKCWVCLQIVFHWLKLSK